MKRGTFTRADVDMLRRLFKQQMDLVDFCRGGDVMVSRATAIDDLADRVEQELELTTQEA